MPVRVDNDIGQAGHSSSIKGVTGEPCIENFDRYVLHARTVCAELGCNCWVVAWTNEHHGNTASLGRHDIDVVSLLNTESHVGEKLLCCNQINHCHNDMVDATGNGVEF